MTQGPTKGKAQKVVNVGMGSRQKCRMCGAGVSSLWKYDPTVRMMFRKCKACGFLDSCTPLEAQTAQAARRAGKVGSP